MRKTLLAMTTATAVLTATTAFAQQTIKIGLVCPFSGQFADGTTQLDNGIKLYVKQHGDTVAGKKLEFIRKDVGGPRRMSPSGWRRNWSSATRSTSWPAF